MSQLPTIASRQYGAPTLSNSAQQQSGAGATRNGGTTVANTSGNGVGQSLLDQISLSKSGVALSAQGMSDRAEELGNNTLDVAQGFLSSFAQQLFGDAANGATVSYDSASLESQSGFAAILQQSSGASGSSSFAGLSLNESSHFIGKGTITTADGQSFDFEIEVQYESRTTAVAQSTSGAIASDGLDSSGTASDGSGQLPTLQLPDVTFPGGLSDLFKLLGQQLQTTLPATTDADTSASQDSGTPGGTLLLRLRNLMNTSALIDAASTAATANNTALGGTDTTALTKAVSNAYGTTGANGGATSLPATATWTDTAAAPVAETPISLAPVVPGPDDNTI